MERKHPQTVYVGAMMAYAERRTIEEFDRRGWPPPWEREAVARSMRGLFNQEFRERYRYDPETQTIRRATGEEVRE